MNTNGIRFTTEQREEMRVKAVRLYAEGHTTTVVGNYLGCSSGTISKFLAESGVASRPRPTAAEMALDSGLFTTAQAAELAGMTVAAFTIVSSKGEGPKRADPPVGAHGYWRFYRRRDVERWMETRQRRRNERKALTRHRTETLRKAAAAAVEYAPNWDSLLAAVDAKRSDQGFTWEMVCAMTAINQAVMSRLRNGKTSGPQWTPFFRLVAWLEGELPEGVREYVNAAPTTPDPAAHPH